MAVVAACGGDGGDGGGKGGKGGGARAEAARAAVTWPRVDVDVSETFCFSVLGPRFIRPGGSATRAKEEGKLQTELHRHEHMYTTHRYGTRLAATHYANRLCSCYDARARYHVRVLPCARATMRVLRRACCDACYDARYQARATMRACYRVRVLSCARAMMRVLCVLPCACYDACLVACYVACATTRIQQQQH